MKTSLKLSIAALLFLNLLIAPIVRSSTAVDDRRLIAQNFTTGLQEYFTPPSQWQFSGGNVSIADATTSTSGLMSGSDKTKMGSYPSSPFISSVNSPLLVSGGVGSIQQSSSSQSGYLSSSDWSVFNGKQAAGNYVTALTGDGSATGPGSAALTLSTVNSNVGTFGNSTTIPIITVNGKGLVT